MPWGGTGRHRWNFSPPRPDTAARRKNAPHSREGFPGNPSDRSPGSRRRRGAEPPAHPVKLRGARSADRAPAAVPHQTRTAPSGSWSPRFRADRRKALPGKKRADLPDASFPDPCWHEPHRPAPPQRRIHPPLPERIPWARSVCHGIMSATEKKRRPGSPARGGKTPPRPPGREKRARDRCPERFPVSPPAASPSAG